MRFLAWAVSSCGWPFCSLGCCGPLLGSLSPLPAALADCCCCSCFGLSPFFLAWPWAAFLSPALAWPCLGWPPLLASPALDSPPWLDLAPPCLGSPLAGLASPGFFSSSLVRIFGPSLASPAFFSSPLLAPLASPCLASPALPLLASPALASPPLPDFASPALGSPPLPALASPVLGSA